MTYPVGMDQSYFENRKSMNDDKLRRARGLSEEELQKFDKIIIWLVSI